MFLPITKQLQNIQNELKVTADSSAAAAATVVPKIERSDPEDKYWDTPKVPRNKRLDSRSSLPYYDDVEDDGNPDISTEKQSILEAVSDADNDDINTTLFEKIRHQSFTEYLDQYDALPRRYISALQQDTANEFDQKYGIRFNPNTEKFYVGDSQINIDGNDFIVKNKRYKGTSGLYELLFKKNPTDYTQDDENNYRQIILKTNAHRRYYQSNKQIDGSRLPKYRQIIGPFFSGKGVYLEVNKNKVEYVHWDDPNELVDRLRLLLASQQAGHTGHINEITSIIEELMEAGVIA